MLEHLLQAEGKTIRPQLLLTFCSLFNCQQDSKFKIAVATEYIHTASLIHDDIIDDAELRRGNKTVHNKWDVKTAILIGDFLYSRAFEIICQSKYYSLLGLFANAANRLSISEINQLGSKQNIKLLDAEEKCLQIMQEKTAILFGVICEAAVVLSDIKDEQRNSTYRKDRKAAFNYGINLGMLFQIRDDYLDYAADSSKWGKERLQDIGEGKITLPLVYLYKLSAQSEQEYIKQIIAKSKRSQQDIDKIDAMMHSGKALELATNKAQDYAKMALAELSIIGDNESTMPEARDSLSYLINLLSERNY